MVAIYKSFWIIACILFAIAGVTDFLDGYCARLYHQETEFGKVLDPIADKILMFCTLWALYTVSGQSLIPSWFIGIVVGKDLILLAGACYLIAQKKYRAMTPSLLSKLITALFMIFSIYLMLVHYGAMQSNYVDSLIQFFTISTILILLDYSYKFQQRLGGIKL